MAETKSYIAVDLGAEMNRKGQKFVDDFESAELAPLTDIFLKGARIIYAHSVLQRQLGIGYTSQWARPHFTEPSARNAFFDKAGQNINAQQEDRLNPQDDHITPAQILNIISTMDGPCKSSKIIKRYPPLRQPFN